MRIQHLFISLFFLLKVLLEHYEEEKQVPGFNFTHSHVCMQTHTHKPSQKQESYACRAQAELKNKLF